MRRRVVHKKPNTDNSQVLSLCTLKEVSLPLAWRDDINRNGWGIPKELYIKVLKEKLEDSSGVIPILNHSIPGAKVSDITRISNPFGNIVGCITDIDFDTMTAKIKLKDEVTDIEEYLVGFSYNAELDEKSRTTTFLKVQNATLHKPSVSVYKHKENKGDE